MAKPTTDQMEEFFRQVGTGRITRVRFQNFLDKPEGWSVDLGKPPAKLRAHPVTSTDDITLTTYTVTVRNDPQVAAKLRAGDVKWLNEYFANSKPVGRGLGKYTTELVLAHPNRWLGTDVIESYVGDRGLVWANAVEPFALFDAYPDLRDDFPVVTMGPKFEIDGNQHVMVFYRDGCKTVVNPDYYHNEWGPTTRFLLRPTPQPQAK